MIVVGKRGLIAFERMNSKIEILKSRSFKYLKSSSCLQRLKGLHVYR